MITAPKQWNKPPQKLELGDEFILPEINGKTITGIFQEISPREAEYLLKTSVGNRGTKTQGLDRLVEDMERDEYLEHIFDPIRISTEGRLLDGHHRLIAITKSGVPQTLLCLYGYTMDDMIVFDQSKGRTTPDILNILGKTHTSGRASAIGWIYSMLDAGNQRSTKTNVGYNRAITPGNKDAMRISDYFSDDVWKAQLSWVATDVRPFKLPAGPIIALKLLYDKVNPEASKDFWDGVFRGKDNTYLTKGDPRNALHTKIVNYQRALQASHGGLQKRSQPLEIIKWVHYAWMKFETGQQLHQMSVRKTAYDKAWVNLTLLAEKHFVIYFGRKVPR